ncbi:MAG: hypothetical protein HFH31_03050 [Bacilli bacterium]|nr:hypothetical protein [Bacilli bacterium]
MKKVRLFVNENEKSRETANELTELLYSRGFTITEENYEIAISIGGDGAFLRMVKETDFDPSIYYIGIHTGTLGFLPEVLPNELKEFVSYLEYGDYKVNEVGVLETIVECKKDSKHFISLNEIVVRDSLLNSLTLDIKLENELLERFKGDGMLVSTSIGSTAYNLSFGGSMVYFKLHTLQLTPIAPFNSNSYRNLQNSVIIPEYVPIEMMPVEKNDLLLTIDGENHYIKGVTKINTKVGNKKIKRLRYHNVPFSKIIKEKFLG